MSSREAQIPLALWISAALVCHALGGGGTLEVAQTALDKKDLRNLVKLERQSLRPEDRVFEVMLPDQEPTPTNKEIAPPDKESDPADDEVEDQPDKKPEPPKPEPPKPKKEEDVKPPPPEVAQKPTPPPPEKKKQPVLVPAVPAPPAPPPPPPPPPDRRIAVMQHAEKNQPDNPNANRIADDANHVDQETMAKIRSHDQDMANPSAGAPKALGPVDDKGNSDKDKEAESEDKIGNDDHAPGENSKTGTDAQHATPAIQAPMQITHLPPPSVPYAHGPGGKLAAGPIKPAGPPPSPGGQGPTSPEVQNGGNAQPGWSMDPANPGGDGASRIAGRRRSGRPFETPVHVGAFGLGGNGLPGGPNINLTMPGMTQAVGDEQLRKERENDGASRRGEHAGRMKSATDFQKYRAAIENYDPSVKAGEKTALNAARSPFASYLVTMHNKIHPLFGDRELSAMDSTKGQFADETMFAVVEIVLAPDTGRVIRRGMLKASGNTAYDTIVLKVIDSAAPFGKAPEAIVSYDGRVYLSWEFHRNHVDACATRGASPIIKRQPAGVIKVTPTPPGAPPRATKNPDESAGAPSAPLRPLRE